MPEAVFWRLLLWHCWRECELAFWIWFDALRSRGFDCFTLRFTRSFFLCLWFRVFHFINTFIVLVKPLLKSSEAHPETRLVSFVVHCFIQDREIWFQRFEVLDASDSTLSWFLIKVRIGQPCWIHKRIGINRLFFRPARSAKRSWADRICNNSWFTNYWFWKFQLPDFHNRFHFNWHFGFRLAFRLDTLHYPLRYRSRFGLGLFMCVLSAPTFPQRLYNRRHSVRHLLSFPLTRRLAFWSDFELKKRF